MCHDTKPSGPDKVEARAIGRIIDRASLRAVGWVYEWNTGERSLMWKDTKHPNVFYEYGSNDPEED